MTYDEIRQNVDRLRSIPLEVVLPLTGALRDRSEKGKWHAGQGVLSVNGAKFMNWQRGAGGGGAIDLVMHLCCLTFKDAVEWLGHRFPCSAGAFPLHAPPPSKPSFLLPPRCANLLPRVLHYLEKDRGLPPALTRPLAASGSLYADNRANAVFLLLGKENAPVGAELRATTQERWRGMAPGSQKNPGYFSVPAPGARSIVLCESAIDAMSYSALRPGRLCISTSGARHNPEWLAPLIHQGYDIYCGFDSDPTGDTMASAMIASYPIVTRLRPPLHDWNDVLRSESGHTTRP
jgi:hypothetical protein